MNIKNFAHMKLWVFFSGCFFVLMFWSLKNQEYLVSITLAVLCLYYGHYGSKGTKDITHKVD